MSGTVAEIIPMDRKISAPATMAAFRARMAEDRKWQSVAAAYGLSPRQREISFASCFSTPALEAGRAFVDPEGDLYCRGQIWQGGVGCGKSTGLIAVLRWLALNKDSIDEIRFYDFPRLSRLLLHPELRDDTLQGCLEADYVLIDDLGAGYFKPTGFVGACIEEIFIHREARSYSLVASTNLSPTSFRKSFGDRVFDRLRGNWGLWVSVDGHSLRRNWKPSR